MSAGCLPRLKEMMAVPTAEATTSTTTTTTAASAPQGSSALHVCDSWKYVPGTGYQECQAHHFVRRVRVVMRQRTIMPAGEHR